MSNKTVFLSGLFRRSLLLALSISLGAVFLPAPASAAVQWVSCTPENVMTYRSRVHIRCTQSFGGIRYFAAPTNDAEFAARVLSVLSTALVAGRTAQIMYDPNDLSGASYGCQANDCRAIQAAGFY